MAYACRMRLLLIEDDTETANYLIKGLRESGHVTTHEIGRAHV